MISRPPAKSLIIHGLIFCIGLGGAMLFMPDLSTPATSHPALEPQRLHRRERSAADMRLSSPSVFRAAYSDLVRRSMTSSERSNCMAELWKQWSATDPLNLLTFLEKKRVWPESCRYTHDFGLSDHPEAMLDFALRNGISDMLQNLNHVDPSTVARLLATLPVEQRGAAVMEAMQESDRALGRLGLAIKEPSPAYRRGVAETVLKEGKVDEFINIFSEVGDPKEMNELAREFGEALICEKQDDEVLANLLRLPEEYRQQVAQMLMGQWNSDATEIPEVREARKRWIEKFAAQGFVEAAATGAGRLFDEESAANRGVELADWISRFPGDGSWQPITKAIINAWGTYDRDGLMPQICALPAGPAREALATEAAPWALRERTFEEFDENDRMTYDRLAKLFTDPQARGNFSKQFATRPDPFAEPFAPPEKDPFAQEAK